MAGGGVSIPVRAESISSHEPRKAQPTEARSCDKCGRRVSIWNPYRTRCNACASTHGAPGVAPNRPQWDAPGRGSHLPGCDCHEIRFERRREKNRTRTIVEVRCGCGKARWINYPRVQPCVYAAQHTCAKCSEAKRAQAIRVVVG